MCFEDLGLSLVFLKFFFEFLLGGGGGDDGD